MEHRSLTKRHKVWLALGSNLGDREFNLAKAIRLLPPEVIVVQVSSIYESEPVGYKDQPWFLNIACWGYTGLSPLRLLEYVKNIEEQLGRLLSFRNAPRPIDMDILLYNEETMDSDILTIPHPRLMERAFVLAPLTELDSNLIHPVTKAKVSDLLSRAAGADTLRKRRWSKLHAKELLQTSGFDYEQMQP